MGESTFSIAVFCIILTFQSVSTALINIQTQEGPRTHTHTHLFYSSSLLFSCFVGDHWTSNAPNPCDVLKRSLTQFNIIDTWLNRLFYVLNSLIKIFVSPSKTGKIIDPFMYVCIRVVWSEHIFSLWPFIQLYSFFSVQWDFVKDTHNRDGQT